MAGGSSLSAGIMIKSTKEVINNGLITLGTGVRNAAGILVGNATGNVLNTGNIVINGGSKGAAVKTTASPYTTAAQKIIRKSVTTARLT